jgi:hypothetical protein
MSGLAKVFLVINLVLAIIFMGTSATLFSVRKDWKAQSVKLQEEYAKKFEAQLAAVKKLGENLEVNANVISTQLAEVVNLRTANQGLTDKLSQASREVEEKKTQIATKDATLAKQQTELTNLSTEVKSLASTLDTAKKSADDANDKARKFNDRANVEVLRSQQLEEQVNALGKELAQLRETAEQQKIRLAMFEKERGSLPPGTEVAPMLNGKVVGVREDLVVVSLGKDEGVKPGMVFRVSRGNQYLGEIQVKTVYKDMSGAQIVYLVQGAQIQEGDDAQTSSF